MVVADTVKQGDIAVLLEGDDHKAGIKVAERDLKAQGDAAKLSGEIDVIFVVVRDIAAVQRVINIRIGEPELLVLPVRLIREEAFFTPEVLK